MLMMRFKKWQHDTDEVVAISAAGALEVPLILPVSSHSFPFSLPSVSAADWEAGSELSNRTGSGQSWRERGRLTSRMCKKTKTKTSKDRLRVNMVTLAFSDFWALNGPAVCDGQIRPAERSAQIYQQKKIKWLYKKEKAKEWNNKMRKKYLIDRTCHAGFTDKKNKKHIKSPSQRLDVSLFKGEAGGAGTRRKSMLGHLQEKNCNLVWLRGFIKTGEKMQHLTS